MPKRNWKMVLFWILGAVCISIGAVIAGHIDGGLGTDYGGSAIAIMLSFILFLLGGLLWISVAIAAKTVREE
jgi:hypothetical protein